MPEPTPDPSDRRRFLRGAGLVGVAGVGGAAAGYLAASARDDDRTAPAQVARYQAVGDTSNGPGRLFVVEPAGAAANVTNVNRAIEDAAKGASGTDLPGGGMVVLPGGDFPLDAPIVLRPGVVLAGSGWGTQLLRRFDGGPMLTFQATSGSTPGAYAAEVRDLQLTGLRGKYRSHENHGILLDATNPKGEGWPNPTCRLHGLRVTYCAGHGIVVAAHPGSGGTTSRGCLLTGTFVSFCTGDGFNLDGSDAMVAECNSAGNDGAGFAVQAGNATLNGCKASYNDGSGFVVSSQRAVLSACSAQDNQPDGIRLDGTTGTTVTGCQGDTNRDANVRIAATTASAITGLVSVYREGGRYRSKPGDGGVVIERGTTGCLISGAAPADAGGSSGPAAGNTVQLAG